MPYQRNCAVRFSSSSRIWPWLHWVALSSNYTLLFLWVGFYGSHFAKVMYILLSYQQIWKHGVVWSQDVMLLSWTSIKNLWILQGKECVHAVLFTSGADYNGPTGTDEAATCWAGQNTFLHLSDFPPCSFSLGTSFLFSWGRPYLATPFAWLSSLVSLTPFPSFFFPCWGGGGIVSALLFSRNCCPIEFF